MLLFIEPAAMDFSFVPFPFSSTKLFHSKPNNMLPLRLCAKFEQIIDSNTRHPPLNCPPSASLNGFGNDFGRKSLTIDARYQHSFSRLSLARQKFLCYYNFPASRRVVPIASPNPCPFDTLFFALDFFSFGVSLSAQESEILFRGGGPRNNAKN